MRKTILIASILSFGSVANVANANEFAGLMKAEEVAVVEKMAYEDDARLAKIYDVLGMVNETGIEELKTKGFKPLTIKKETWLESDFKDAMLFKDVLYVVNKDGSYAYSNGFDWVGLDVSFNFDDSIETILKSVEMGKGIFGKEIKPKLNFGVETKAFEVLTKSVKDLQRPADKKYMFEKNGFYQLGENHDKAVSALLDLYDLQEIENSDRYLIFYNDKSEHFLHKVKLASFTIVDQEKLSVVSTFEIPAFLYSKGFEAALDLASLILPNAKKIELLTVNESGDFVKKPDIRYKPGEDIIEKRGFDYEIKFNGITKQELRIFLMKKGLI